LLPVLGKHSALRTFFFGDLVVRTVLFYHAMLQWTAAWPLRVSTTTSRLQVTASGPNGDRNTWQGVVLLGLYSLLGGVCYALCGLRAVTTGLQQNPP
jgi:hypothetical protein